MIRQRQPGMMTGITLLLPVTLAAMAIVLLTPNLPQMLREFSGVAGYEYLVPMILTIPALCIALLSPLAGILGDYFGRRRLLLASFALYAGIGILPIFLHDLSSILVSRIGVGVAEALIMVLSTTMIGDYYRGVARDKWLAGQTAFASISAVVFLNVGGQLGSFGWRAPFWAYLSALGMMALVVLFTWEPRGEPDEMAESAAAPHNLRWTGFPWPQMLTVLAITVVSAVFFYTVPIQSSNALSLLGLTDPAQVGFLTSIASVGVPIGTLVYARAGRTPVRRLLMIEFATLAAGYAVMGQATSPTVFLIGCFVNQVGAGALLPTLLVWTMSFLKFEVRARGAGLWQSAFAFGQFLSPVTVTFVANKAGGLQAVFIVFAATAVIGSGILALVVRRFGSVTPEAAPPAALHG